MSIHTLSRSRRSSGKGFTLVELIVSIAIFAMMTALLVAKYSTFNQSVLLTNLAYDVALTVRTAQTYGLSIRAANDTDDAFKYAYGVDFSTANNKEMILFGTQDDLTFNGEYLPHDFIVSRYSIKRGASIKSVCVKSTSSGACELNDHVNITFKRPDPSANICAYDESPGFIVCDPSFIYADVVLLGSDGSERTVKIRNNGQVSVLD